jgi:putative ABC transport system ATP-binding protein
MKTLIKIEDIIKTYYLWTEKLDVLKNVSLEVYDWDFLSIMGQSGSGKSTMMNIIWMLDNPTSGKYFFNSLDVSSLTDDDQALIRRWNIWFIFQSYNLLPKTSAIKQVMLPLIYQWVKAKERYARALEALKKVWLESKINNLPSEMSGWQQQRVSIARALVTNPLLILADEPTWALDSKTWEEVMELLAELNKEWKTIVIITHEPEIDHYAKRHIHLKDGEIISEN